MDEWKSQRQDSLEDQLVDLIQIAVREGMYDAADYILNTLKRQPRPWDVRSSSTKS